MTHLLVVTEGYPEGIDNMMRHIREHCVYELRNGAKHEIGSKAQPSIREIRLFDIVVKDDVKERFLSDIKPHSPLSYIEEETTKIGDFDMTKLKHGVKGKGFRVGIFRRILQFLASSVNARAIDMNKVKANTNTELLRAKQNEPWHGYIMVLGELPDGFENSGRENS